MTRIAGCWMALAVAAALAGGNPNAKAQGVPTTADGWPNREDAYRGITLKIVTEGTRRMEHTCRVVAFTEDRVECGRRFGRKPRIYRKAEVVRLAEVGRHTSVLPYFPVFLGGGAGVVTGAVFLASVSVVAAVPVAILGGLLLWAAPLTGMMADDDVPDTTIYVR